MASAVTVLAEIRGSSSVIHAKRTMMGQCSEIDRIKESLAGSLVQMVRAINQPISSVQVSELMTELRGTEFDQGQKMAICTALECRLVQSRAEPTLGPTECQKFTKQGSIMNYLTPKDWAAISSAQVPFTDPSLRAIVVKRMIKGGFFKPSAPSAADIVAALAAAVWNDSITKVALYESVQSIMKEFREHDRRFADLPMVRVWPETPADLPPLTMQALYPDADDQPTTMPTDMFIKVRKQTACRDVNKHVREELKPPPTAFALAQGRGRPQPSLGGQAACAAGGQPSSLNLDVAGFLSSAAACGINPQQAMMLGSQMLAGGHLGNAMPQYPSRVVVEELDEEQSLASQLARVRNHGHGRGSGGQAAAHGSAPHAPISGAPPMSTAQKVPEEAPGPEADTTHKQQEPATGAVPLASSADATAAALGNFGVGRAKSSPPSEPPLGLSELDRIKSMEREHELLVQKARARKEADAVAIAAADEEDAKGGEEARPKGKAKAKAAPKSHGTPARKRPAAAVPETAAKRKDPKNNKPRLPEGVPTAPAPGESVAYLSGKVLASVSKGGWRVWPDRANVSREKTIPFGKNRNASFADAIRLIQHVSTS